MHEGERGQHKRDEGQNDEKKAGGRAGHRRRCAAARPPEAEAERDPAARVYAANLGAGPRCARTHALGRYRWRRQSLLVPRQPLHRLLRRCPPQEDRSFRGPRPNALQRPRRPRRNLEPQWRDPDRSPLARRKGPRYRRGSIGPSPLHRQRDLSRLPLRRPPLSGHSLRQDRVDAGRRLAELDR